MPYDPDSGLVYSETSVHVPDYSPYRSFKDKLLRECNDMKRSESNDVSLGAPTLRAIACNCVLENYRSLTPEIIRTAPTLILRELYDTFKNAGQDNLATWQLFARGGHYDHHFTHKVKFECTASQLQDAISVIRDPDLTWLVDINIVWHGHGSLSSMLQLSSLNNVRNLCVDRISNVKPDFGWNKVLREWTLAARDERAAFSRLKSLIICCANDDVVSPWFGLFLSALPALESFGCIGPFESKSLDLKKYGWRERSTTDFLSYAYEAHKSQKPLLNNLSRSGCRGWAIQCFSSFCNLEKTKQDLPDSSGKLPSLDVTVSITTPGIAEPRTPTSYRRPCKFPRMIWLERDLAAQAAYSPPPMLDTQTGPAEKKRKVKDGRAVDLRSVLDGL